VGTRRRRVFVPSTRLSPLDASFLAVETPTAHMHVGWAAIFAPPDGESEARPSFAELRDHIARRLPRAPRYRQMLKSVPLGIGPPVWTDDTRFDITRHVVRARSRRLSDVIDEHMSEPLPRDRPLWQIRVAERLEDGRLAIVGKAHHCMVDGIAAVELASLLLDPDRTTPEPEPDHWAPEPAPRASELVRDALADLAAPQLKLARVPAQVARSPSRALDLVDRARQAALALGGAARPVRREPSLNPSISPRRHLGLLARPVAELTAIKDAFGVKLNDVVLAASAGAVRAFLKGRGERPIPLKTMVPVSVRESGTAGELGNRISFMFVDLPCEEPDPVRRLREIHTATSDRKRAGAPEGADDVVRSIGLVPSPVRALVSRLMASPRAFNLTVSNIPGPREPMYMRGCRLEESYPVVPIADGHALSIGMSTIGDGAFFGLYADPRALPEVDDLADGIETALDELSELASKGGDRTATEPIAAG
jgi:diacylglycerol O-acyltransferase